MNRPTAAEWAAKLDLKRVGGEFNGPCPLCGGADRFHVHDAPDRDGLVGCRGCGDSQDFYADVLRAVFGEDAVPAKRDTRWKAKPPPEARPAPLSEHSRFTVHMAKRVLRSARSLPPWVVKAWRSGLLEDAPEHRLQWLDRDDLLDVLGVRSARAAGALVAALGSAAVHLVVVGRNAEKVKLPWVAGKSIDKITLGSRKARGFPVGGGSALYVTEGVADAVAVARDTGQAAVAAIGTDGLRSIPLAVLGCGEYGFRSIVLVPDSDAVCVAEKAALDVERLVAHRALDVRVSISTEWVPDPAAAWERRQAQKPPVHVLPAATFGAGTRTVVVPVSRWELPPKDVLTPYQRTVRELQAVVEAWQPT